MTYDEKVRFVEQHGGAVRPQSRNPHLDHVWNLKGEGESLCGLRADQETFFVAGHLCLQCSRSLEKWMNNSGDK